jgi:hypothetical protein
MNWWQRLIAGALLLGAGIVLYLWGPDKASELAALLAGSAAPILGAGARDVKGGTK